MDLKEYLRSTPESGLSTSAISWLASLELLQADHPDVAQAIIGHLQLERSHLKMIASENHSSLAVQLAMGNLLTDKYAEGTPQHRFYPGCEQVDFLEALARDRLKELFDAQHAYVQPHSGADANMVAFWSILTTRIQNRGIEQLNKKRLDDLSPQEYEALRQTLVNQTVLGMSLNSGGHLTHGYRHNISSKMMRACYYDVDPKTHRLDYQAIRQIARREKPLILIAGYSSYTRLIDFAEMRSIADEVGAVLLVDMAHFAGLVAGKAFTGNYNPVPFAHMVTSTTHKTLRGPRGGFILSSNEFKAAVDKGCPLVLGGPLPHVMAAKAVAFREALDPSFREYARQVVLNAQTLAEQLLAEGMTLLTGGTDNHQILVDLTPLKLTGLQGAEILSSAGIYVSRNTIPNDPNGPWHTSGLRIGSQALTSRGMGAEEMRTIGKVIAQLLRHTDPLTAKQGSEIIQELTLRFPLYPELPLFPDVKAHDTRVRSSAR